MAAFQDYIIVGGSSRLGKTLCGQLAGSACSINRLPASATNKHAVDDYAQIPDELFVGKKVVINCVGTTQGSLSQLRKPNVDIAVRVAEQARAAKVSQYIHISSFSVYGDVESIEAATALAPTTDYGKSKLEAEEALLELQTDDFGVCILRLPLLYGFNDSKLEQLVNVWKKIRWFPIPKDDVNRSMISYKTSSELILKLAESGTRGTLCGADPELFSYRVAAKHLSQHSKKRIGVWVPPLGLLRLAKIIVPSIFNKLYTSSVLHKNLNSAIGFDINGSLYSDIENMSNKASAGKS